MHGSSDEIKKEQSSQAKLLQDLNEKVMKIKAQAAVLQQNLVDLRARSMRCNLLFYASVNSTGAQFPPGQPRGICSRCQSLQRGIRNFIAARGLGICLPRGDPRALDTRVFESAMEEFIGKDKAFVEDWLVRQGLHKLVDVFKGMFSQF